MERWMRRRRMYSGRIFNVTAGTARLDDGTQAPREVVGHPGGVAILPVYKRSVILIRQYRIAIGQDILEIPAGKIEEGEDPPERAAIELEEETGFRAGLLVPQAPVFPSVGYTSEKIHMFLAFRLSKTRQRPEFDERIEVVRIPLKEAFARLDACEFLDAKTALALYALRAYLGQHPEWAA